ncbi:ABC transporter ATP-binding protein [bacterium]|nr:MAG: ABC transporter ATP-binding protein [bacterium]
MNIIQFNNVTKRFGDLTANDNITLGIKRNTVHCILGENGAGKTTLMKVFCGFYRHDSGEIFFKDNEVRYKSPLDAIKSNIGMLHQHFMLIDDFTVLENVVLGNEITKKNVINYPETRAVLQTQIDKYNLGLRLETKVSDLSVSEHQKVELLKLLYRNSEVLIFDEPTAVLSPLEVSEFFKIVRKFVSEGKTIILITHKLKEVLEIADYVTVLRKGRVVFETAKDNLNIPDLGKAIVGDISIKEIDQKSSSKSSEFILKISELNYHKNNINKLNNLNFKISKGSVYGICGVEGNGQNELADILTGVSGHYTGEVNVNSDSVAFVPDDRISKGMIKEFSIGENVTLKHSSPFLIKRSSLNKISKRIIDDFDVRVPDITVPLRYLSGGNQQKVIFAREVLTESGLLILYQPTRGVDINSTIFIHNRIIEQRNKGKSILLISSDLDELLSLSDIIGVIYKGKIVKELNLEDYNLSEQSQKNELIEYIGKLMIGVGH